MAKGHQAHQDKLQALSLLGKPLARRSGSKCELCETSGVALSVFEVPPAPAEPDLDHCLFLCELCRKDSIKPFAGQSARWRCLSNAVWSEIPAVQVMATRILRRLSKKEDWARELLDQVLLEEQVEDWVNQAD